MDWSQFIALLQRKPRVAVAMLVMLSATGVAFAAWYAASKFVPAAPPERISMIFYYDQNTGELFEVPAGLEKPLSRPSGTFRGMPAAVRAQVFSCGRCDDPSQRMVGWLEAPSAAIEAAGLPLPPRPASFDEEIADSVLVIRTPEDERWLYFESHAGQQIVQQAQQYCTSGGALRLCEPPRRLVQEVDPQLLHLARRALAGTAD